jgi:hypothetical protein
LESCAAARVAINMKKTYMMLHFISMKMLFQDKDFENVIRSILNVGF